MLSTRLWRGCLFVGIAACQQANDRIEDPGTVYVLDEPDLALSEGNEPSWVIQGAWGALTSQSRPIVANYADGAVMFFDSAGALHSLAGGMGEGPGRFGTIGGLYTRDDTVIVWDSKLRRFTVMDTAGRVIRTVPLMGFRNPVTIGATPTRYVVREYSEIAGAPRLYYLIGDTGSSFETVNALPAYPKLRASWPNERGGRTSSTVSDDCAPSLQEAVVHDVLYLADSKAGKVYAIDTQPGATARVRLIYTERSRLPVTEAIVNRVRQRFQEAHADTIQRIIAAVGDTLVAWRRIKADGDLGLLLLSVATCNGGGPNAWTVVDTAGNHRGTIQVASGTEIISVRNGTILTVRLDTLGVEYVERHRIPATLRRGPAH